MLENTAEKISPILIQNNRKRRITVEIQNRPMTLKEILQNCDDDFKNRGRKICWKSMKN